MKKNKYYKIKDPATDLYLATNGGVRWENEGFDSIFDCEEAAFDFLKKDLSCWGIHIPKNVVIEEYQVEHKLMDANEFYIGEIIYKAK